MRKTINHVIQWLLFHFPKLIRDDKVYLRIYWQSFYPNEKPLDLENPKTFNEKMNWIKIHDRNEKYTLMADKFEAKKIASDVIGEEHIIPCYGVWNTPEEINFESLPDKFVLKATHDSSGAVICKNINNIDRKILFLKFNDLLKRNWFYIIREWPYKNIKPRIIAEQLIENGNDEKLLDYKFWCFNGTPKIMYITNKGGVIYENFYDMSFSPIMINHGYPRRYPEYCKPEGFDEMVVLAKKLSSEVPFIRIDFFLSDKKVYFGEYTFYDWGAMHPFDDNWDAILGEWLSLPNLKEK